jgi:putative oxidoreductase
MPALDLGIKGLVTTPVPAHLVLQLIAAAAAALLLAGFWTPIAGLFLAAIEIGLVLSHSYDPWLHILLAALGAALAMLGPGAWSVDARLFGRKRIHIPQR